MNERPRHPLFDEARAAPLQGVRLGEVEARLTARATQPRPPLAWAGVAAAALAVLGAHWWAGPAPVAPQTLPAAVAVNRAPARFELRLTPAPVPAAVEAAGMDARPAVVRAPVVTPAAPAVEMPPPVIASAPRVREPPAQVRMPPPPPTERARPKAAPATRLAYQPRAIREFLEVDWSRWEDRDLPSAVARMIRLRDPVGLLAALDALDAPEAGPELLSLRCDLRGQVNRPCD